MKTNSKCFDDEKEIFVVTEAKKKKDETQAVVPPAKKSHIGTIVYLWNKTRGVFHSTKIPVRNFETDFTCPMERYIPVAKTRPKQPRVWLLFLKAGYKTAVLGTTILTNGEKHFGPTDRDNRIGQREPPSKLVPNFPVGPNRHGPLHLKFPEFWVEWKAAYYFPLKLSFGLLKQTVPNPFPTARHQTFL